MIARAPKLTMDILELASALSMTPAIVREMVREGMLPRPIVLNGSRRWITSDIRRWVEAQREAAIVGPSGKPPKPSDSRARALSE